MRKLKDIRDRLLPELDGDFTSDHEKYRHENNVNLLTFWQWYWLHPTAYRLLYMMTPFLASFIFTIAGSAIWFFYGFTFIHIIVYIMIILQLREFWNRVNHYEAIKETTFYDIHLRDFGDDSEEPKKEKKDQEGEE